MYSTGNSTEEMSTQFPVPQASEAPLTDSFGRVARKLRISVTDRCNFRCGFCMPSAPLWLGANELLTFEEITRVTRILGSMGVTKVRLSGGEPLLRPALEELVSSVTRIPAISEVGLTTNGMFLAKQVRKLAGAGLSEVTVSLHSLKPERYDAITGTKGAFETVLAGLDSAKDAGLRTKVNCVVTRGCNEDEICDFARLAYEGGLTVRFIEYMPFDGAKPWNSTLVVSGEEIISKIRSAFELEGGERAPGSTATNFRFRGKREGGVSTITSITKPFCSDCDRIRLKANGMIVPCLFSNSEFDIRSGLRSGESDERIAQSVRRAFNLKFAGVESLIRSGAALRNIRPMHVIGG